MIKRMFSVTAHWDDEAKVFYSDSDIVGLHIEAETIEEVYEPFLIQEGFLMRTPRGREATAKAYEHLGKQPPLHGATGNLFGGLV